MAAMAGFRALFDLNKPQDAHSRHRPAPAKLLRPEGTLGVVARCGTINDSGPPHRGVALSGADFRRGPHPRSAWLADRQRRPAPSPAGAGDGNGAFHTKEVLP